MLYELPNKVIVNLGMVTTISVGDVNLLYFHFEKGHSEKYQCQDSDEVNKILQAVKNTLKR